MKIEVEGLRPVIGCVVDLESRWREAQERLTVVVNENESMVTYQDVAPVPPAVAWDYLTSPEKKIQWRILDKRIDVPGRRIARGVGTETHCVMHPPYGRYVATALDMGRERRAPC